MNDKKVNSQAAFSGTDLSTESWRLSQIMAEVVEGLEKLSTMRPCLSMFGFAGISCENQNYSVGEKPARILSDAGFSIVTGGGQE